MFALRDTLAENVFRALAMIVADPRVERRVREELSAADLSTARGIDGLRYLEGCVQEAMRLWPTTPMIVRQTVHASILAGTVVPRDCQVLIWNTRNHRLPAERPFGDAFHPEFWRDRPVDYRSNHLSNGTQVCAGIDLALFVAKGVLASLLYETDYELRKPKIAPAACLPDILNHFAIRFDARSR
jgi:cytochrome P450